MIIAKIKLAPGNAGWYDQTTGIHLTIANPIAEIKAGMNLERIRTGLRFKTIELLSGSVKEEDVIETVEAATVQVTQTTQVAQAQKEEIIQEAKPQVQVEEKEAKKTPGRKKKEEKK